MRALRAHEHRSAAGLLALLTLVYLWPALVEGALLSPTALLYALHPWQDAAPYGVERWFNGDLGDVPLTYYPWNGLAREFIHAGTFPAWNPYAFGGTPLFANSQMAWLSPFSLPLWTLPLHTGLAVAAALKLWMAGFGTYLLARELRLGFAAAIVAGISFALCAFNVVWLSYGVFVSVAVMLPWALWLVERIVRHGRSGDGLALAAVLAVALVGGHPGTEVHVLAGTALYALVRAATISGVERRTRGMRLGLVGGGIVVALLLAAVVLLPAQQAAIDTHGAAARMDGAPKFRGSTMPADVVRTMLFPDWWGRPSEGVIAGPASYRERTFYAGTATLLLALIALCSPGGWRRKAPFAALAALGLGIVLRVPGLYDLVIELPGFDRVQNSRIYLWPLLAVAVLGGFGLQRVLDTRGRLGFAWIAPAAGLLAAAVAAVALAPDGDTWTQAVEQVFDRTRTSIADPLALASVLRWALLAAALGAIVVLLRRVPRAGWLVPGLLVLVVALDMLQFADGYQPMGPADKVIPPRTPAISYLVDHRDEGRIAGVGALQADWSTTYRLRDASGFDSPLPTLRFARLWRTMDPEAFPYGARQLTMLTPRILGLLGARNLILPAGTPASPPLRSVYEGTDATVVENPLVAPRAFVARSLVATDEDHEFALVAEADFDPRRDAIVRADQLDGVKPSPESAGSARIVGERNAEVTVRATLDNPGVVVLGDTWGPGWSVSVDGRDAEPLEANIVLRGVVVPRGTHEIVWSYQVPGLRAGLALTIVGALAMATWAALIVVRARRSRSRAGSPRRPPTTS